MDLKFSKIIFLMVALSTFKLVSLEPNCIVKLILLDPLIFQHDINKDTGTNILAKLDKAQIMKLARLSRRIRE
jgi:hypothetical protein